MIRDTTLSEIKAFETVARLGSFALAAEELHITQPAISRRIRKLEETLGARLLDRTTRSVRVSKLGQEFLPKARRIVEDFHQLLDDINERVQVRKGIVSFSCNMTISDTLLPRILEEYKAAHPDIRIRVHEDSSPQAMEKVRIGQSELALAQFGDGHPELEFETLINDQFVLACHASHPLARAGCTTWQEIVGEQLIFLRSESGTRRLLKRNLGALFDSFSIDFEVGHFHSQLGLVGIGAGIAAIPTLIRISRKDLDLATIPIAKPTVCRQLGIVTYNGRSLSPAAEQLRAIARSVMRRYDRHLSATASRPYPLDQLPLST